MNIRSPAKQFTVKLGAESMAATAALMPAFAFLYVALLMLAPPDAGNLLAADPLVKILVPVGGIWLIAAVALLAGIAWLYACRPSWPAVANASRFALAGVCAGLLVPLLIRPFYGDALPAFIPPEESAAPGMALGVGAGLIEETLFRLGVLPLTFLLLQRRAGTLPAAVIACTVTGLLFALSHETGATHENAHFITRLLIPGIAMSLVAAIIHPAFMVAAHVAAHVAIALLFVAHIAPIA